MVSSMPSFSINIRLTILFQPHTEEVINFTKDVSAINFYIIPKIKKLGLYHDFVSLFGEDIKEEDTLKISEYALKIFYLEEA
jgi:hypothetical protein